jgi:hypothetical protein
MKKDFSGAKDTTKLVPVNDARGEEKVVLAEGP